MTKLEVNPVSSNNRDSNNEAVDIMTEQILKKFSICSSVVVCLKMGVQVKDDNRAVLKRNIKLEEDNNNAVKGNNNKETKIP